MSWEVIDVEGKKMYERYDGIRVESTEQIEAIEQKEDEFWKERNQYNYLDYLNDKNEELLEKTINKREPEIIKEYDSNNIFGLIIFIIFVFALIIILL